VGFVEARGDVAGDLLEVVLLLADLGVLLGLADRLPRLAALLGEGRLAGAAVLAGAGGSASLMPLPDLSSSPLLVRA
jgi:hypothetical protein